ncbi:aldo/keto reductase [Streptomyces sp. NBC_00841]|uniref:aldo/keto reductase n=1 Tax=unclassified Streptomyces TaxID=2593676 RepID=UPI00224F19EB|nr:MULTISPECIES: aldo/keto reductase [unclassified Streptomyces]MCX4536529.1 aldo/keto reductase [Streptomyces sp. NBC_01669]WRZ98240.1 aldo/keto reductase [Streptomyces sp. NBC_00841]
MHLRTPDRTARVRVRARHRELRHRLGRRRRDEYSLVERTADRELLPMAESLGLGAALWSPLGGGLLTGKYRSSAEGRLSDLGMVIHTESTGQKTAVVDTVLAISEETGVTPAQVAVAWVRERAARSVATLVPIIGPRSLSQLDSYLGALDV